MENEGKYRKKKESSTSKSKYKSKHKHEYESCLIRYPYHNSDNKHMSDEELAEFLKETVRSYGDNLFSCYECLKENECSGISHCSKFITWLKQPIKK